MRAVIRVILEDTTDEQALDVRKKIIKLLEPVEDVKVELTLLS